YGNHCPSPSGCECNVEGRVFVGSPPSLAPMAAAASLPAPAPGTAAPGQPEAVPAASAEEPARERDVEVPWTPAPALAEFVDRFRQPETAARDFDPIAHMGGGR